MLLDIHTHHSNIENDNAIYSYSVIDKERHVGAKYISFSIHPWHITEDNLSFQLKSLKESIASDNRVVAVGECGIDKLCDTPLELQLYAFEEVAKLANTYSLPLIIHSVRSSNEIITLRKKIGYDCIWIIHGFRGKPELASEYLRHNIYLSFGEKYNRDALLRVPLRSMFLETDESDKTIDEIAYNVSLDYGIDIDVLKREIHNNIVTYFPIVTN